MCGWPSVAVSGLRRLHRMDGEAMKIRTILRISVMASTALMPLDFVQGLEGARYRLRLSLHIPRRMANQGLNMEALFSCR